MALHGDSCCILQIHANPCLTFAFNIKKNHRVWAERRRGSRGPRHTHAWWWRSPRGPAHQPQREQKVTRREQPVAKAAKASGRELHHVGPDTHKKSCCCTMLCTSVHHRNVQMCVQLCSLKAHDFTAHCGNFTVQACRGGLLSETWPRAVSKTMKLSRQHCSSSVHLAIAPSLRQKVGLNNSSETFTVPVLKNIKKILYKAFHDAVNSHRLVLSQL